MLTRDGQVVGELTLVEVQDPAVGQGQGFLQVWGRGSPSRLDLLLRDAKGIGAHPVKPLGQFKERGIALRLHLLQDRLNPLGDLAALAASGALGDGLQPLPGLMGIPQQLNLQLRDGLGTAWRGAGGHETVVRR